MSKTILQLEAERMAWSLKTFPEATAHSALRHLECEIREIEIELAFESNASSNLPTEYADALMLIFDSAGRAGISPEMIFEAFEKKLEINKKRVWKKNPDNSYSHVKP